MSRWRARVTAAPVGLDRGTLTGRGLFYSVQFEILDAAAEADPTRGRFVLHRPHHSITVTWQ